MVIQELSPEHALKSLESRWTGLTTEEAGRRLDEYGSNRLEQIAPEPVVLRLLKEFGQFFSVILWVAAALAFAAEWSEPGQGMARIGAAIVLVILVSGVFSFWQELRMERTLAALQKLLPSLVRVLRDDVIVELPAEALVVGDVVLLGQGDNVPADCRLVESFGVRVNNATVTGESAPQPRDAAISHAEDSLRARNVLLAGTSLFSGEAKALVFATGKQTQFGRIAYLAQTVGERVSPLRQQLVHVSRLIVTLALTIGLSFFAVGAVIGVPFWQDFIFSIGIIVAMVPEGLLPTLTLALVLAAQRMAKRNVLIRHLPSVETLGSATVICTDKTGTLTENRMRAREVVFLDDSGDAAAARPADEEAARHVDFFRCAALCHDLREARLDGEKRWLGDPMEIALVEMARSARCRIPLSRRLDEVPFDAERMRQSVVQEMPEGPILYCKGAPEAVLPLCSHFDDGTAVRALDPAARERLVVAEDGMAERGLRVLALAARQLRKRPQDGSLEEDLCFLGLVGLEDPPRPEVHDAVRRCREAGIRVIMVTGDHPRTGLAIARAVGLIASPTPTVVHGDRLRELSAVELGLELDRSEIVFARVAADQKMRIVEALKRKKEVVAVTGDGVNDAPALKAAHIGVAMGVAGTDVAKQAADMVLLDDNFASIVAAVEEGRAVFQNIRKFLTYVLVHNVAQLVPYLAFASFAIPLPLTPIQVLSVDMGTDSLTALGLGVERPEPDVMRTAPRRQDERLLDLPLALRAYLFLGVIEAAAAMSAYFFVLARGGWSYGEHLAVDDPLYLQATAACLSAIVFMQVANVFLCRSPTRSVLSMGVFDNRLVVWGVALEILLLFAIDYTPWGNDLLGTRPLPIAVWLLLAPFAAAMIFLEEMRKFFLRTGIPDRSASDFGSTPGNVSNLSS